MIRVAVLGSTGMLGHTVVQVLSADRRLIVVPYCRRPGGNERRINASDPSTLHNLRDVDYVINCIGLIKQLPDVARRDWYAVNSVFPWLLQEHCIGIDAGLIHVSTDCVFAGTRGNYTEDDVADAQDDYGVSKSCGDPQGAMVLRTSVVGRELKGRLSLLEWAISQAGQTISGYTNHSWNGLSSVEYARICGTIITDDMYRPGIFHVHSDPVSKHRLLCMINATLGLGMHVRAVEADVAVDRTLATVKELNFQLQIPSVAAMIAGL